MRPPSTLICGKGGLPHGHGVGLIAMRSPHLISDDRLNPVGKVGDQHAIRHLPGRCRPAIGVDRLDDVPVAVEMHPVGGAFERQPNSLGGAVVVGDTASERGRDPLPRLVGERLTGGGDEERSDVQPASKLLSRQQVQRTGVAAQYHRGERIEFVDQLVLWRQRRKTAAGSWRATASLDGAGRSSCSRDSARR